MFVVQIKDYIYDLIFHNDYIIREVEGNWDNWKAHISTSWKFESDLQKFIQLAAIADKI